MNALRHFIGRLSVGFLALVAIGVITAACSHGADRARVPSTGRIEAVVLEFEPGAVKADCRRLATRHGHPRWSCAVTLHDGQSGILTVRLYPHAITGTGGHLPAFSAIFE